MCNLYTFCPISVFLNQTLCCDHSLESSWKDDSNKWWQHKIWLRNKDYSIWDMHLIWGPERLSWLIEYANSSDPDQTSNIFLYKLIYFVVVYANSLDPDKTLSILDTFSRWQCLTDDWFLVSVSQNIPSVTSVCDLIMSFSPREV